MKTFRSFFVFSIGTVLLLLLRTWQLLFMFDAATGFYKPQYSPVRAVLCEVAFLIVLGLIVLFPLLQRVRSARNPQGSRLVIVASLLTSFAYIYGAGSSSEIFSVEFFLSLLAGLFFFLFGLFGLLKLPVPPIACLSPLPLWLYRLFVVFSSQSGVSRFTENAYEIITLCAILLFILNCAKFLSGIEQQGSLRFLTASGFLTAALCFICTVPRCIVSLLGATGLLHGPLRPDITIFATGIFALALTFYCLRHGHEGSPLNPSSASDD